MRKSVPAADPDAYVRALTGWRRACVETLRAAVRKATELEEAVKWGHLVYAANGPVLLIRAEDERVLFGFWRGQRLREIEPRLKPGGKYEMATLELREGDDDQAGGRDAAGARGGGAEPDAGRSDEDREGEGAAEVTAAFAGATAFVGLLVLFAPNAIAAAAGFAACFVIRTLALHYRWSLPVYRAWAGRTMEEVERLGRE